MVASLARRCLSGRGASHCLGPSSPFDCKFQCFSFLEFFVDLQRDDGSSWAFPHAFSFRLFCNLHALIALNVRLRAMSINCREPTDFVL